MENGDVSDLTLALSFFVAFFAGVAFKAALVPFFFAGVAAAFFTVFVRTRPMALRRGSKAATRREGRHAVVNLEPNWLRTC